MYPCMNIIIDSKYAPVYAAVHSSVWVAVSRKRAASDSSCKTLEFLILQVVMSAITAVGSVVQAILRSTI